MFKKQIDRREFLRLSALTLGAATLAACAPKAAEPGAAPAAADQVTIVQYYHEYGEEGCAEASLRYAEEYTTVDPKVKVDRQWIPGDYAQKLNAALLTDQAPDVFESGAQVSRYKAGLIADMSALYEGVKDDFNPKVLTACSWQGKIMGIRMIVDTGYLCCRKSILDGAGVKPPETMPEVVAAAKALTTERVKGIFLGNDGYGAVRDHAIYATGLPLMVDENRKVVFNTERAAQAIMLLKQLNDEGSTLVGNSTDWWDPAALTTGLTAMQWMGMWATPKIQSEIQDDFYVVPWPKLDGEGTPATFLGGWTEFVNDKSKYKDQSLAFSKWLWIDNTKNQIDWSLSYGFHIPPRNSTAASADKLKTGAPKQMWDICDAYGRDESPFFTDAMGTALNTAVANIIKSGADAKTELDTAAAACQAELDAALA